ncbi:hypothetical protein PoB_006228800 [Plakobranchus ocellatus]|uniref:Uncharacterized protein n=1 Tax=Plakobranchus ocellatus TaxID=259542 RepID=A0AAV4CV87_9GAST|nr:hypothetical protein PoB_006228800 [Plakobranchus ocellatus]
MRAEDATRKAFSAILTDINLQHSEAKPILKKSSNEKLDGMPRTNTKLYKGDHAIDNGKFAEFENDEEEERKVHGSRSKFLPLLLSLDEAVAYLVGQLATKQEV